MIHVGGAGVESCFAVPIIFINSPNNISNNNNSNNNNNIIIIIGMNMYQNQ
jgi:hypothetical protein